MFQPKITSGRKCTDILCLLIFIAFWFGMVLIGILALQQGDPEKLLYGTDHLGNTCGGKSMNCGGACADKKRIVYPRTNEDLMIAASTGDITKANFFGICVAQCPPKNTWVCTYEQEKKFTSQASRLAELTSCQQSAAELGSASVFASRLVPSTSPCKSMLENCWRLPQVHEDVFFRCLPQKNQTTFSVSRCVDPKWDNTGLNVNSSLYNKIPLSASDPKCLIKETMTSSTTEEAAQPNYLFDTLNSASAILTRYFSDVALTWGVILGIGVGVALVTGFAYLILLRFFAGIVVWLTVVLVLLAMLAFTLYCYFKAGILGSAQLSAIWGGVTSAANNVVAEVQSVVDPAAVAAAALNATLNNATAVVDQASPAVNVVVPSFLNTDDTNKTWFSILAYAFSVFTGIMLILTVFLHRRISIAVGIIKESSKCIGAMPFIVFYPIVTVVLTLVLAIYFLAIAAYLHTAGALSMDALTSPVADITKALNDAANSTAFAVASAAVSGAVSSAGSAVSGAVSGAVSSSNSTVGAAVGEIGAVGVQAFQEMSLKNYLMAYHFFGFLWTNQFFQGIGILVIAGAVCHWYWTADKEELPKNVVLQSVKRTLVYHLGTIAFGSFLIALIQFVRAILAYLDKKSKSLQNKNFMVKLIFKCVACCLWCFEKCLKFISKNAYIITAMEGLSFCRATIRAGKLILNNVAQVGVVSFISFFVIWIGKLMICAGVGVLAFFFLDFFPPEGMQSMAFPVVLTTMLGYYVGSAFLSVYSMAIDTILLCFCLDRENNDGSEQKPYFMGDSLRKFVDASAKSAKEIKEKEKEMKKIQAGEEAERKAKEDKANTPGGGPVQEEDANDVATEEIL